VRQFPQPGEVFAKRVQDQGGAGHHGPALVARRDAPPQTEATDLSNIVPFARPRRQAAAVAFPLPSVTADERPAPYAATLGFGRNAALVGASLALHSALLAMFWHEPRPMASIGIEVMTVEITLGATTAAGLAPTPGEQEAQAAAPAQEHTQEDPVTEQSRVTTVMPQEVPVATQETASEVRPEDTPPEAQAAEPKPPEQKPESAAAELPAAPQPTEKPPERTEQPRPKVQAVQQAPERKRIAAPTDKKAAQKKQLAATTPSDSSSGVGRGRSDNSANYNGIVAAHLARHKQYPAAARSAGAQGVATVSFSIDGGGRVTSARLAGGSGNAAIDQEVVAMARRASPFPAPPDGKGRNFTVPVRFNLR
jgi:periplasmic protein TonB